MALASQALPLRRIPPLIHLAWICPFVLAVLIYLFQGSVPWATVYPDEWRLPIADGIGAFMQWVIAVFFGLTRAISALLQLPLDFAFGLLSKGFEIGPRASAINIPPLSWVGVVATVAIIGHAYGGWRLALIGGLGFLYLAVFGGIIVYSAYMYLLGHVSSALATSYAYVNPVVAVGLGLGLAGEQVSILGLIALVVILVGASCILLKEQSSRFDSTTSVFGSKKWRGKRAIHFTREEHR